MRLLRRLVLVLSVGWLVVLLGPLSGAGLSFRGFVVYFGVTAALGLASLAPVLLTRPRPRWMLFAWLVYPAAAAGLLVLFLHSQSPLNPLFRLRFEASRSELEGIARLAVATRAPVAPKQAGLFRVRRVDVAGSMVWLVSGGCGVVDECGLLYAPDGVPARLVKMKVRHITGPWYHLYAIF